MAKDSHHSFSMELAIELSVEESLVIHHLQHWIKYNKRLNKNFIDGKWWTYQTQEEISAHLPYYSYDQIRRILKKLISKKIIIKGNYNKNNRIQTLWYAFVDEEKFIGETEQNSNNFSDMAKSPDAGGEIANCSRRNRQMYNDKILEKDAEEDTNKESSSELMCFGNFVKIKKSDYENLCEDYGKEEIELKIQEINDFLASTGKKPYKDYAATIRNWLRRKNIKPRPKISSPSVTWGKSEEEIDKPKELTEAEKAEIDAKNNFEKCQAIATKIQIINSKDVRKERIWIGPNLIKYPEIPEAIFYYNDNPHAFKEKNISTLRKMNLIYEGI